MTTDKYRYHIYDDRIYVIQIDEDKTIELSGSEIVEYLMGCYVPEAKSCNPTTKKCEYELVREES